MQWFSRKRDAQDNAKAAVVACEVGDSWKYGSCEDWFVAAKEFCQLPPSERRWHECINPQVPVRLFYDIDGNDMTKEQMGLAIQTIQTQTNAVIGAGIRWVVLDGSRPNKQSVHVLTDVYFATIHCVRGFVEKEIIPKLPSDMVRYFDTQVYRGGNFRTAFSHKHGVPMQPADTKLTPEVWVSLLLTAMPSGAKRYAYHVPEPRQRMVGGGGAGWSKDDIYKVITIIEDTVADMYRSNVRFESDVSVTSSSCVCTIAIPISNMPCERKHGVHKSNRIMLQVHLPLAPSLRRPSFVYFDLCVRAKFHCMDSGDCGKWADWSNPHLDALLTKKIEECFQVGDGHRR